MNDMISVIMSVYNEELVWIKEAISSILNQSYLNLELLVVVDNPLLDEEKKMYLQEISDKDKRVKVEYNEKNIGLALSLNKGIELAKGNYIARMDADDISEINRLELQLEELEKRKVDCIGSGKILINEMSEVISDYESVITGSQRIKKMLPHVNCFVHPSILIKREFLEAVGGYRNFRQSQDYDLWLRLNEKGCLFDNVDIPLIRYRVRESGITGKKPYVQYLTSRYERLLLSERIKYGKDNFSEVGLKEYIERHNGYDDKKNKNFSEALEELNKGISLLKKDICKGTSLIFKSILKSSTMLEVFYRKIMAVYYRSSIKVDLT